jgi:hypothetical protein
MLSSCNSLHDLISDHIYYHKNEIGSRLCMTQYCNKQTETRHTYHLCMCMIHMPSKQSSSRKTKADHVVAKKYNKDDTL